MALAPLAGCGSAGKLLRVGSQKGGTKALMLASGALDGADYKVEWSEFPAAQNLLEALASHAVDVGLIGDAPFLFAYQNGKPLKAVAARAVQPRPTGALSLLVAGNSPIREPKDLRGVKIATTRGSIGHFLVLKVLDQNGLRPDSVELVFLTPSDAAAALHSGAVQAWSTWGPYVATGLAEGYRVIADGHEYHNGVSFDVVHDSVLTEKPALLADFIARENKAQIWRQSHLEEYAAVLAKETGLPLPIARVTARIGATIDAPITPELVAAQQGVQDLFVRSGGLKANRPLRDAYVLAGQLREG